jgi:hypothetical protein
MNDRHAVRGKLIISSGLPAESLVATPSASAATWIHAPALTLWLDLRHASARELTSVDGMRSPCLPERKTHRNMSPWQTDVTLYAY